MTTTRQAGEATRRRVWLGQWLRDLMRDFTPAAPASDLEQVIQERNEAVRLLRAMYHLTCVSDDAWTDDDLNDRDRAMMFLSRLDSPNG